MPITVHPDDIQYNTKTYSVQNFLFNEILAGADDILIHSGWVVGQHGINIYNMDINCLIEYLKELPINGRIGFDDIFEGLFLWQLVHIIHRALAQANIDPSRVYYFSAMVNGQEVYDKFCEESKIKNKINILGFNYWGYLVSCGYKPTAPLPIKPKEKLYLCFNRIFKLHRFILLGLLLDRDLVKSAWHSFFLYIYSQDISMDVALSNLSSIPVELADKIKKNINKHIDDFPMTINIVSGKDNKNYLNEEDLPFFENSYFSLVTETGFYQEYPVFFSEKIFKPIMMRHPFILASTPHSLRGLRALGFLTFSPWIDESYDDIINPNDRLAAITDEVDRLHKFTADQWLLWQHNVQEILEHNFKILTTRKQDEFKYSNNLQLHT